MKARHILIISYVFPPNKGIGGRRWAKFAKYLAKSGHKIFVIHCAGEEADLGSPWSKDVADPAIQCYSLPKKYPTVLSKRPLNSILDKLAYRYWLKILPHKVKGNIFDKTVNWRSQLLNKCNELIEAHGIENVIVTGAPFRLLFFALELKEHNVNLIGDLRDPWTWNDAYGYENLGEERMAFEEHMEKEVMEKFDHVLSPAQDILDRIMLKYPGVDHSKFTRIAHAFDRDDMEAGIEMKKSDETIRFIYAGGFYDIDETNAYMHALIQSVSGLIEKDISLRENVKIDFYVPAQDIGRFEKWIKDANVSEQIRFWPPISASEVFTKIMNSDYVLAFLPSARKEFLSTKYSEIFSLGVPVIHVGPEGYVSHFIDEHKTGFSFRVNELQEKLEWIIKERPKASPNRSLIASLFDIEQITEQLERDILI